MTLLACVPAPDWAVLGGSGRVLVAEGIPLAMVVGGVDRLVHPQTGVSAEVHEICAGALAQFPRERDWTVGEFARVFAKAYAPVVATTRGATLRALVGGIGPSEKLAAVFDVVLESGRPPVVARVFDPYVSGTVIGELPSYGALNETIESAVTLVKNPPARKVARLVRRLLGEALSASSSHEPGEVEVVMILRDGVTRVAD